MAYSGAPSGGLILKYDLSCTTWDHSFMTALAQFRLSFSIYGYGIYGQALVIVQHCTCHHLHQHWDRRASSQKDCASCDHLHAWASDISADRIPDSHTSAQQWSCLCKIDACRNLLSHCGFHTNALCKSSSLPSHDGWHRTCAHVLQFQICMRTDETRAALVMLRL